MTTHHADFAIPVTQGVDVKTKSGISGRVIALGWWVDPDSADDPQHEPAGTLYLVVDPTQPRPVWVLQADIEATRLVE